MEGGGRRPRAAVRRGVADGVSNSKGCKRCAGSAARAVSLTPAHGREKLARARRTPLSLRDRRPRRVGGFRRRDRRDVVPRICRCDAVHDCSAGPRSLRRGGSRTSPTRSRPCAADRRVGHSRGAIAAPRDSRRKHRLVGDPCPCRQPGSANRSVGSRRDAVRLFGRCGDGVRHRAHFGRRKFGAAHRGR